MATIAILSGVWLVDEWRRKEAPITLPFSNGWDGMNEESFGSRWLASMATPHLFPVVRELKTME